MKKTITRVFAILLTAVLLCGILPLTAGAADGIDITDKFIDPAFRAAVYDAIWKTAPEPIYDSDVARITGLDVSNRNIKSLDGLIYFSELEDLWCFDNQLVTLPTLPSNLKYLLCDNNQLISLPVLPTTLLTLWCRGNQLTALPVLPSSLEKLSCDENRLTILPSLPANLIEFDCYDNQLSALPALPPKLESIDCGSNRLTTLPALPASLITLWCFNNRLSVLPALPMSLRRLICSYNQLTSLDVTGLQFDYLDCDNNRMKSTADVKGFTGTWDNVDFIFYPQNPTPFWSTWPPFLQWILQYVLFGWLWMRWF